MNAINNQEKRITPPNKAYDSEYATQFRKEMEYLKTVGIEPTYIKKTGEYRIPTYKYTKTPKLFKALTVFYEDYYNKKNYEHLVTLVDRAKAMHDFTESVRAISPDIIMEGVLNA